MIETKFKNRRRVLEMRLLYLWLALLLLAAAATPSRASSKPNRPPTVEGLAEAIRMIVRVNPPHPLNDPAQREEFAEWVQAAAKLYKIPATLVLSTAYVESSLWARSPGKIGEIGLMQVHGSASKHCNLSTKLGQLECGAKWLKECKHVCGTWKGAITMYMLGSCRSNNLRVNKSVRYRLRHWARVKKAADAAGGAK